MMDRFRVIMSFVLFSLHLTGQVGLFYRVLEQRQESSPTSIFLSLIFLSSFLRSPI